MHPFRQHAPLCAHPPQGIQAQTHHLICDSLFSPSSRFESESKEEGSGSVPTRGRRVFPITRAPALGRYPPRSNISLRGGKASLRASRAPTGAGPGTRVGQGRAGSGDRLPDAGAARSAVSPAGSRSSSRAGTRGALLHRLLPAPTPGARAPPAPSDPPSLPPRRPPTRPRLFPHRVSAAAGAARGPGSCSGCCPTEPSPRRRRRHSPIVRMRCKLHMLASDRRSAPGPV